MNPTEVYSPGLEGVLAGETAVSTVSEGLCYRGYAVVELAERACFEEVAYLLLHGQLPNRSELTAFETRLAGYRALPGPVTSFLRTLPAHTVPMDALRSTVSMLAHYDPDSQDNTPACTLRKAERLLAQLPLAIVEHARANKQQPGLAPKPDLSTAANFLFMLRGKPATPAEVRALDVSLTLYAEHEFNASTFTARVITSTEADLHSALVGAIGALKGRLHGGANEKVMDLLRQVGEPEAAESWLRGALLRKEKIMGFGHRVYKTGDVRAGILKVYAQQAAGSAGTTRWEETAEILEQLLAREKNLYPNLDWPAGRLYHSLGLEPPLYTPIFVMSRVSGWAAHVLEQAAHNRIIRPRARYTGPARRAFVPLAERT